MSTITIPTRDLVGLLEDAVLTAADKKKERAALMSVLLHTDSGLWPIAVDGTDDDGDPLFDEVPSDLLVATSSNMTMVGQAHTACSGQLHKPVLISLLDADAVIDVFKPLVAGRLPKTVTHETVITVSAGTLIVSENPNQIPGGKSVTATVMELDDFPRNLTDVLQPDPKAPVTLNGHDVAPSYGTGLDGDDVGILAKVARRRKMHIVLYRSHQSHRLVATIGQAYRAVMMPLGLKDGEGAEPLVDVFTPDLPARHQLEPLATASGVVLAGADA